MLHVVRSALMLTCLSLPAVAQELSDLDRSVFFFGGPFHTGAFGNGLQPWNVTYESNFIIAAGLQQTVFEVGDLRFGGEIGVGGRFGAPQNSVEIWGGPFVRYDGLVLGPVRVSPSFTFGLSATTAAIGVEATRAAQQGIELPLLVYLGPEINLSLVDHPEWEVFWRLQHRSGGFGWIADIDGSNAEVVGIRYKF